MHLRYFLLLLPLFSALGCHSAPNSLEDTGFLGDDYAKLKPVASPETGIELYRYLDPHLDLSEYEALMLDPVVLFQTAFVGRNGRKVSEEDLYQVRRKLDEEIFLRAKKQFKVVHDPGPHVIRASVAITGVEVEGAGFKPRNLVPIAAVLFAAQKATSLDKKTPQLIVEAKVRDSMTGKVLGQAVYKLDGERFRKNSTTLEAFRDLAIEWVAVAIRLAAGRVETADAGVPGEAGS